MTVQFRRRPARTDRLRPTGFADQQLSLLPPPAWPADSRDSPDHTEHELCVGCSRAATPRVESFWMRFARTGVRLAYSLVRPALRPLAWRTRGFLLTDVLPQLDQLRAGQSELVGSLAALSNRQAQIHEAIRAPAPVVVAAAIDCTVPVRHAAPRRKVHQFHAGSATGDAITNAMLLIRNRLRAQGYESEIFVEHLGAGLEAELLPLDALPMHDDHVLLVHHSMGHARFADVAASPAPKVLIYHNITPPELLTHDKSMRQAARLGRAQLVQWRAHVCASLTDSIYNGLELRRLGFAEVAEATLLFDVEALLARAAAAMPSRDAAFTVLFVGRIVASKGQAALVDAFARFAPAFRREHGRNARLVLAGVHNGASDPALIEIRQRIALHALEGEVLVTGKLSDDALFGWFGKADMYVSLSRHEGFGVPLVEALAHGIPVVALAASAVPYTVAGAALLLPDSDPGRVATAMLEAARAGLRLPAAVVAEQLAPWRVEHHWPALASALARAGAATPVSPDAQTAVEAGQHIVVTGQINGSYSLAVVNRRLALALETVLPGQIRLQPIENDRKASLTDVPKHQHAALVAQTARPAPQSGPVVAISQHYPLLVPDGEADVRLAMLFWEETLLPAPIVRRLNAQFSGVLAPSRSVARALADSGVRIPIRHVGFAPDLRRFEAVGHARAQRRGGGEAVTNFLHVSSCFPRKGVDVLLAAWAGAFRMTDSVRLVIKGFPNPHNDVAEQIAVLRETDPDIADIVFINRDMPTDALVALYAEADVMVLPSRGEGFNIPAAEALAAQLRLIVTGTGGHMDFCGTGAQVRLLDYRLTRARSHVATRHALWAEPDAADLVRALREAAGLSLPSAKTRLTEIATPMQNTAAWAQGICRTTAAMLLQPPHAKPRVAWITPWRQACGVAEYSRHLLGAFPAASPPAFILCDERPPADAAGPALRHASRAAFRFGDSHSAAQLALAVGNADPDVLVIQHQPGLLPWDGLARLLESPILRRRCVVVALHNTRNLLLSEPALRARVASCLARVRRVLVHALDDLAVLQDLGVTNTVWLPHGTTPGPAPLPPRDMGDAPVIGTTGFALPHKGLGMLIEAVALLRVDWPGLTLRLICARYPDPVSDAEIAHCRKLARALDVEDAVEWHTQFLPNAARLELLSGCDIVVMPYAPTQESASGAVRQALASGVPTLVSDLPIFADLEDAVARIQAPSAAKIAAEIQNLLQRPRERAALQTRAQAWLADHDWKHIAERLDGMLDAYHQEHLAGLD